MTSKWAQRQRDTNHLVRLLAGHVIDTPSVTSEQLYGLCRLTWITNSFEGDNPAYIASTKIPALQKLLGVDYSGWSLEDVALDISEKTNGALKNAVAKQTGFTNFYKAYRNTSELWIKKHFNKLLPLFKAAYHKTNDAEGLRIMKAIEALPGIPRKGQSLNGRMGPERLLTPAFFALDPQLRFPIINGNRGVMTLLKKLQVRNATLSEQYRHLIELYGKNGVRDAADLDQLGHDLPDFVTIDGRAPIRQILQEKLATGKVLPLKDESDVESLQEAKTVACRRIHNQLTNKLLKSLSDYNLQEGCNKSALFDVAVKNYNGTDTELFIEVKSSAELPHIRMAVGQLYSYWYSVNGEKPPHLAVLLPTEPLGETKKWLKWLDIGVLWFHNDVLATSTTSLQHFCD